MFFATNYLGICGIEGIKKLGLRMPEDIAVASFDEHDLFRLHDPGITCISQPTDKIARAVVDVLVSEMESETGTEPTTQLMLPSRLIVRGSSGGRPRSCSFLSGSSSFPFLRSLRFFPLYPLYPFSPY